VHGRVCVITGGNSGIGRAMAEQIGALGAHVVIVCRNADKGRATVEELRRKVGAARFELVVADLSVREEIRRAAREIQLRHPKVDVLINNAGVYLPRRHLTAEGFEVMFATNHLGPFLLTGALMEALVAAAPARVITVSSEGHRMGHIDLGDLQAERHFSGLKQYCNTKLANILFTRELSRRFHARGISANAFHPGTVRSGFAQDEPGAFGLIVRLIGPFLRTPEYGARTGTFLATAEDGARATGAYFAAGRRREPAREALQDDLAAGLWEATARLARVEA
jgi:NAD(P)-dependent dehydrogenase (short-subunit alcohol dehydrogenase family)